MSSKGDDFEEMGNSEAQVHGTDDVQNYYPSPLMHLPVELWDIVLNKLPQKDACNLRLVNKTWNSLVNSLYSNWIIPLDENCPGLENLLNLRVKGVKILQFLEPLIFRTRKSDDRTPKILTYPEILEQLDMEAGSQYENSSIISPQNLCALLKCKNLKDISLSLVEVNLSSPHWYSLLNDTENTLPGFNFEFAELSQLKIKIRHRFVTPLVLDDDNIFHRILNLSKKPKLRSLHVLLDDISQDSVYKLWLTLFSFLETGGHGLKSLKVIHDHQRGLQLPFEHANIALSENCYGSFETLEIDLKGSAVLRDTWRLFLGLQGKLKDLKVNNLFISSSLLTSVAVNNFETLASIEIPFLTVSESILVDGVDMGYFNLEVFQNCHNLKKLHLSRAVETGPQLEKACLGYFNKLPTLVEDLDLSGFLLNSGELFEFAFSHFKLKSLSFKEGGSCCCFGVNGTVLDMLLGMQSLKSLTVQMGSINSEGVEEGGKLIRIFTTYGNKVVNKLVFMWGLELARDPVTNAWRY